MNTCETCKHWRRYRELFPDNHYLEEKNKGGLCGSRKLSEEYDFRDYVPDALVYPYQEGGYFWTGPQFGCVHHEPLE